LARGSSIEKTPDNCVSLLERMILY